MHTNMHAYSKLPVRSGWIVAASSFAKIWGQGLALIDRFFVVRVSLERLSSRYLSIFSFPSEIDFSRAHRLPLLASA